MPLALMHLLVDAICACCIVLLTPGEVSAEMVWLCVAYNVLAFATQPLVGIVNVRGALTVAVTLLACAAIITSYELRTAGGELRIAVVVLLGLGNSLFHVWGGRRVAQRSGNDMRHLGVFVSTGALGLLLGSRLASTALLWGLMATLLLVALAYGWHERRLAGTTTVATREERLATGSTSTQPMAGGKWLMALLMLLVMMRSLYGQLTPTVAHGVRDFGLLTVLLAVAGKMGGGWLGTRWGAWRALTAALLVAGVALVTSALGGWMATASLLLMVLAINVTMPMTLHLMNRLLPGREGLAFGLLAAALLPGVGLALLPIDWPMLYALTATLVIEALVLLGWHERRWQVLGASVVMNVVTNLALNAWILYGMDLYPTPLTLAALELLVTAVEAVGYHAVMRDARRAVLYAVSCNAASCAAAAIV